MRYRIKEAIDVGGTYYSTYRYRIYQKKWWHWRWKYTGMCFTNWAHAELWIEEHTKDYS